MDLETHYVKSYSGFVITLKVICII